MGEGEYPPSNDYQLTDTLQQLYCIITNLKVKKINTESGNLTRCKIKTYKECGAASRFFDEQLLEEDMALCDILGWVVPF